MVNTFGSGQISEGMELYGSDGEKLGKVIGIEADSIVVEKGFFFPTDYYVPTTAVASVDGDKAYLNVTKDAAVNQSWDTTATTETYATTQTESHVAPATETFATTGTTTGLDAAMPTATATAGAATWPAAGADRGAMTTDTAAAFEHSQTSERTHQNTDEGLRLEIHEEELSATTRAREIGEVQINKEVVSEQRTIEVPITEERVRVQRRAVDRPLGANETAFEEGTIDVPIMGEEVQLQKSVHVAEEVEIGKEAVQRTEQVTGTVRREEVRLTETGETGLTAGTAETTTTTTTTNQPKRTKKR